MVSTDVVLQTVKRMVSTGVDDATIKATLQGIGLSDPEILQIIRDAKGLGQSPASAAQGASQESEQDPEQGANEELSEGDDSEYAGEEEDADTDLKDQIEDSGEEQLANHTTTNTVLDQHTGKMEEMHNDISALHEKLDSTPRLSGEEIAKLSALDLRISALEREVAQTKANTIAIQGLLQKILETNRKTLLELQKK